MITLRHLEGKQQAWKREGIFQQKEARMTIDQLDTIVYPFMLGKFLHDAASRCIIQDRGSKKFHLAKLGHLRL